MRSPFDGIIRQFLRFHFGRWTPRDDSNPIETWQRAKREAEEEERKRALDSMRDREGPDRP